MYEISQQDIDIMNYLAHGCRILYYTEDTITKANIDNVKSNNKNKKVSQAKRSALFGPPMLVTLVYPILLINLIRILDLPF